MNRLKIVIVVIFAVAFALLAGPRFFSADASAPRSVAILKSPRNVAATDGDHIDRVNVTWNAVRDATLYRVFRAETTSPDVFVPVGTTTAAYYFDTTATAGTTYIYAVRAEAGSEIGPISLPDAGTRNSGTFHSQFFSPLSAPPVPAANQITAAKANLGKTLFWDEQLSSTMTTACGTCHRPAAGGADPRTSLSPATSRNPGPDQVFGNADDILASAGVPLSNPDGSYSRSPLFGFSDQVTGRKAPSYLNAAITFNGAFWDGRASAIFRDPLTNNVVLNEFGALESQSLGPPLSSAEMAHAGRDLANVTSTIGAAKPLALATRIPRSLAEWIDGRGYPELFTEAFGSPEITPTRIALALGTHQRTLFSDRTPLDRWASLNGTLTTEETRGRQIFEAVNCVFCHSGPVLADQNFHNIGVRPQTDDIGRAGVTGNNNDRGRFKTPNLRNIELRAPYMHNGRFQTLEEVVEFYNRGGDFDAGNINRGLIRPLNLTPQQKADLVAFLKRPLTDERVKNEKAPFDRPLLATESNRSPTVFGSGRTGSGGFSPKVRAIEPPVAGNANFTVAVFDAIGAGAATLVVDSNDPGVGSSIPSSGDFARVEFQLAGTGNGNGAGSVNLQIPAEEIFYGRTFTGRFYVTDAGAANGFSVSEAFRFTIFGPTTAISKDAAADFDGDGRSDISIFRPAPAEWWISRSTGGVGAVQFGANGDRAMSGDVTGDGRADIVIWRPNGGEWLVLRSEDSSYFSFPFGSAGDVPLLGDFDADGTLDPTVFRPSQGVWYSSLSATSSVRITSFGSAGDRPVSGDFDGDGRADPAIYRAGAGEWWIARSSGGTVAFQFGLATDIAVPADFTGDGATDAAFFRPSTGEWFILRSEDSSYFSIPFGAAGDIPVPGDFDGDSISDVAVFRPSTATWFASTNNAGVIIAQFGQSGDEPLPSFVSR